MMQNEAKEPEASDTLSGQVDRLVSQSECSHINAFPVFGPVYSCPDCGKEPVRDICTGGWRTG